VSTGNPSAKATMYKGNGEAIISVANWTDREQTVSLKVDWGNTGINPSSTEILIPEIVGFQAEQKSVSLGKITIPGKKGFIIVLKKKNR